VLAVPPAPLRSRASHPIHESTTPIPPSILSRTLKPAYLIHGDDHGAIAERRAGLQALALKQGDAGSVEALAGDAATPAGVAQALAALTFAIGRRVIVVDGVERWKQAEVEQHLVPALKDMPPDTTVALFAREEGRAKAPAAVHAAVKVAQGQIVEQGTVKPWELPKWAREQAVRLGLALDQTAAKALVAQVGERQQRILRELEKLALELAGTADAADAAATTGATTFVAAIGTEAGTGTGTTTATAAKDTAAAKPIRVSAELIEERAAHSAERRVFVLADSLVGGDTREATLTYLRLRRQGERLGGLGYLMASRLREALAVALRLQAGESAAEVKRTLRMPSRAAERFVADVARADPERLRAALGVLADLELDTRGGAELRAGRSRLSGLHEDTLALRAIAQIAG
jgi:DNA polymerase III subunit delta